MGRTDRLVRAATEKRFFKYISLKIRQRIDGVIAKFTRWLLSKKTPIQNNKVVVMHYDNKYQCNPAYICNEILRQELPWEIVYVVGKKEVENIPPVCPEKIRVVARNSFDHFKEMASAKIWLDNAMCCTWEYVPKKKGQFYINTWHGSMGLKRIDSEKIVIEKWKRASKLASRDVDFMISNSAFETDVYRTTYWKDPESTKILELGHPRNDILFCDESEKKNLKRKVCEFFDVPEDTDFILYAPTFRDSKSLKVYDINYDNLIKGAQKRFGGKWMVINRYHFKVAAALSNVKEISENPNILNGNDYADIQELMAVCKIGITDYSSWICDYILTDGYGFIYANDLDDYNSERGFYYPLESTPFPIATDNDGMLENLVNFDENLYSEKKVQFLKDRGCKETGNASEKVVDLMKQIIDGKI
ncbi:MAG: CDP-glycerol glycerophosphotransferase family protein [Oscillospiraceae bacterium]|nr:CDP-glycerol glycerophosphotransferase family protein [Oscillospiraceae bacterium]